MILRSIACDMEGKRMNRGQTAQREKSCSTAVSMDAQSALQVLKNV